MAYPTITPLPDAPSRSQDPDAFATTADTFVAALPDLVTEVNAAGDYIDQKTVVVGNDFQGTYSAGTTYTTGQSVLYSGTYYVSLVDANTGNTPDSSPSQWSEIFGQALPSQTGNDGLFLTTDGSTLSWGAAGGGGSLEFVASGAISNGDLVGLNSDGTVSVVQSYLGSPTVAHDVSSTDNVVATYDSNSGVVVVCYRTSAVPHAVVGTVSGTSISFGTPVQISATGGENFGVTFDSSNNKIVFAYEQSGPNGVAFVGTVSGTSISFGSGVTFHAGETKSIHPVFDSTNNKVVLAYKKGGPDSGEAIVGTVSGTSISFGSGSVFVANNTTVLGSTFDSNSSKVVITYRDEGNSGYYTAVVGTVSGTSISFGTPVVADSLSVATGSVKGLTFDSTNNKVVGVYRTGGTDLKSIVGTVSGTSISFGTPVFLYNEGLENTNFPSINYDTDAGKVIIFVEVITESNYGWVFIGTVSGTSISFNPPVAIAQTTVDVPASIFDPTSNSIVIFYEDTDSGNDLTSNVFKAGNFSAFSNWVGIAEADVADTATGTFTIVGGVNESQTGLSTGSKYYLQNDATIGTRAVSGREIGLALSSTKLFVTQGSIS